MDPMGSRGSGEKRWPASGQRRADEGGDVGRDDGPQRMSQRLSDFQGGDGQGKRDRCGKAQRAIERVLAHLGGLTILTGNDDLHAATGRADQLHRLGVDDG